MEAEEQSVVKKAFFDAEKEGNRSKVGYDVQPESAPAPVHAPVPVPAPVKESTEKKRENHKTEPSQQARGHFNTWFQTASTLDRKANAKKRKGDIDGALEAKKHVLHFRQACLEKRKDSKRTTAKARREVASTMVELAHLHLIKEESREAEALFKEAMSLYKASGVAKEADCMQEIKRELDRLRWQSKKGLTMI